MSDPVPTFGQICVEAINLAAHRPICGTRSAEIIDAMARQHCQTPRKRGVEGPPSPFGDRKGIPPLPALVEAYSASIGYPLDGPGWCDSYATKGWKVGRTRMVDWQAACRAWKINKWGQGGIALPLSAKQDPKSYTSF
jgi:hypothetical protein